MKNFILFICFCSARAIAEAPSKNKQRLQPAPQFSKQHFPDEDDGPGFDGPNHDSCKKGKSCQFLNAIWAKDLQHVYLDTWDFHGVVSGLDPKTFVLFDPKGESPYAKDAKSVFYFEEQIPNVDLKTFQQVNDRYGKDGKQVYQGTRIMSEADPFSFTSVPRNAWYAKDNQHVYYSGRIVAEADPNTFVVLKHQGKCGGGCWFEAQDGQNKFANGKRVILGERH